MLKVRNTSTNPKPSICSLGQCYTGTGIRVSFPGPALRGKSHCNILSRPLGRWTTTPVIPRARKRTSATGSARTVTRHGGIFNEYGSHRTVCFRSVPQGISVIHHKAGIIFYLSLIRIGFALLSQSNQAARFLLPLFAKEERKKLKGYMADQIIKHGPKWR